MSMPTMTQCPERNSPPKKRRYKMIAAALLLAIIGFFLYPRFHSDLKKIRESNFSLDDIRYGWLAACFACMVITRFFNAENCRLVFASFGKRLSRKKVVPVLWTASLGRYIPGKVLTAGAVVMFVKLGVDWSTALAALGLSVASMALMSLMFALPTLYYPPVNQYVPYPILVSIGGALIFAVFLYPRSFTGIANFVLIKLKRRPFPDQLDFKCLAQSLVMVGAKTIFMGLALYCAGRSAAYLPPGLIFFSIGIASLASFAGFVAFPLPAGIGVHEMVYMYMFQDYLPIPLAPVAIHRLLNVLADGVTGAFGMMTLDFTPDSPVDNPQFTSTQGVENHEKA